MRDTVKDLNQFRAFVIQGENLKKITAKSDFHGPLSLLKYTTYCE
ncbi:hypothetical protein VIBHAR_04779 [Vibrio campbellii ATCC BAA-1116]|uniref:Uncharacterized protein n=1 Tax=Vibrio campbellii (strain ATCC BAA-1116) TaxID=2902295 RepID=A7N3F1_VIBC1|nr:hypothetical protein VIBHAR_04779 [Vibrio campbellii ATCC BAA-1116]